VSFRGGPEALLGAFEHRPAQVDQREVEVGEALEKFEAVIACAATYVEQVRRTRVRGGRGLGNQLEDQRRVDRG